MADLTRKTANLLDYKVLFSNSFVKETASFKYYRITVTANTQYTLKSNAPASVENAVTTFLYGRSDTMSTANDGLYTDVAKTITSTDDGYVYIAVRKAGTSTTIPAVTETDFDNGTYTIMLNEGSTALPYEPYWQHSLRKLTTNGWQDASIKEKSENLIPTNISDWEQGGISSTTGTDTVSTIRLRTKDYYPIENDTDYYISVSDTDYCYVNIILYNSSKQYVGQYYIIDSAINGTTALAINIPSSTIANVSYYRVVLKRQDDNTILANEISNVKPMMNTGSTALPYEPYWK